MASTSPRRSQHPQSILAIAASSPRTPLAARQSTSCRTRRLPTSILGIGYWSDGLRCLDVRDLGELLRVEHAPKRQHSRRGGRDSFGLRGERRHHHQPRHWWNVHDRNRTRQRKRLLAHWGTIQGDPSTALVDIQTGGGLSTAGTHLEATANYGVKATGLYASFVGIEMTGGGYTSGFYVGNGAQFSLSNSYISINASTADIQAIGTSGSSGNPVVVADSFVNNVNTSAPVITLDGLLVGRVEGGTIQGNGDCIQDWRDVRSDLCAHRKRVDKSSWWVGLRGERGVASEFRWLDANQQSVWRERCLRPCAPVRNGLSGDR